MTNTAPWKGFHDGKTTPNTLGFPQFWLIFIQTRMKNKRELDEIPPAFPIAVEA